MVSTITAFNQTLAFLKMAASSAILNAGLEELFRQDLADDHFISTIVNMSSLKFVVPVRGVNELND